MSTPNILLIQADQHRYDCVGANGHPFLQTPNLDRLAQEGVNFSHAFTPTPICTPARASLMTGLWPGQHGFLANDRTEVPHPTLAGLPTFSQALQESGYSLSFVGKWGVDRRLDPTHFGFDEYVPDTGYFVWRRQQELPPIPQTNGWFGETDTGIGSQQSSLAWGAGVTIDLLRKAAGRARPFFLRWDTREPHLPNIVPEPYASLYSPDQIPPWPSFPDPLIDKPYIQRQQRRTWGIEGWPWSHWAPMVGRYLGEISLLDAQVGRILQVLDELGLAENTLVAYTSDHGDLTGAHGLIDKHYVMYEDVVRVPLILRWPDHLAAGRTVDAFVCSALDLASTFCDAADVPPPATFMGNSLLPLARGEVGLERPDIFAAYYGNQFGLYSQRMVRDRRWKYVWNPTAEDELYDLESDPGEITNLAGRSEFQPDLQRLRLRLIEWMERTQDRLLNGWTRQQLAEGRKI